jgi:hypothetical protein
LGTTETDLIVDTNATLAGNLTIPGNIRLSFEKGKKITLGNYNLTVNGLLDAGPFHIFNTSGSGSVNLSASGIIEGYAEFFGIDGTADEEAINEAFLSGIKTVRLLPYKTYKTASKILLNIAGQKLKGTGGTENPTLSTIIECSATSGPVIEYSERSIEISDLQIHSTAARFSASTSTGYGILGNPPDAVLTGASRPKLENIYIYEQPTDGVYIIGGMEHGLLNLVVVQDCKRHGFLFDSGTRYGRTNIDHRAFEIELQRCRALECGGNALVVGYPGEPTPYLFTLNQFEALGCCWKSSARISDYQIDLTGLKKAVFNQVDVEDQQYANNTTAGGNPRTARDAPASGMYIGSGDITVNQPYFSSLSKSVVVKPGSVGIRIIDPEVIAGSYGVNQNPAIELPGTVTNCYLEGSTQSGAAILFQNLSMSSRIVLDGVSYIPAASTGFDVRDPHTPDQYTISGGTLTAPTTKIYCNGEGGAADDLFKIRYFVNFDGYAGHKITLFYAGESITLRHAANNILCKTGADTTLNSSNTVMEFIYDGTNWVEQ